MQPNPRVRKWLKRYNRTLDIEYNHKWHFRYKDAEGDWDYFCDPEVRWVVTQTRRIYHQIPNIGISYMADLASPVLYVPQAQHIDYEWIEALERNKFTNIKAMNLDKWLLEREQRIWNNWKKGYARDWAKEVGYWHFNKQFKDFRFPNVRAKDPSAKLKAHQDLLGRELR
jgi:hypothetical protein